ncbi:aminoacyl-histidine dipeptidase [Pedobacter antarcticus]|uniref:aminoacyl-histidine dipeptidase n=1 Tax=Pedobacter antarcticus TaxID=34086 RepID=UPI000883F488|nr:aminoacyl-histidine dipeptidase [Pedobacter antarcticus]SDL75570.1 dipeptidase D [Pedobacter antarcticus]
MELKNLEPQEIWQHFTALNAVPRASKKEERVIAFMQEFGRSLGLDTRTDKTGNVIILKPATPGMEDRKTVILQSHLDMVHQKNSDTVFDFEHDGIKMYVDGDWVKAEGTTLGADNGIGVAAIMGLLAAKDIAHPALEAMFTIDEETGMTGAKHLDPVNFTGKILLNLDTEEDDELTIGCAGGIDTNTILTLQTEVSPTGYIALEVKISGLTGGHSGMDIHKGRANANKLITRLIKAVSLQFPLQLSVLDGGSLRNAIPREASGTFILPASSLAQALDFIEAYALKLKTEYQAIETSLQIVASQTISPEQVFSLRDTNQILNALYAVPNGVFRMSPDIDGLVEASSNLARVILKDGEFITKSLQRSSVESTKDDVSAAVRAAFESIGAVVSQSGDYPGWKPDADSDILRLMTNLYEQNFGKAPKVEACHAGLECGILGGHFPEMDMISFGPTIRGAHSPDERVQISSVQKFWSYLQNVLKEIPKQTK